MKALTAFLAIALLGCQAPTADPSYNAVSAEQGANFRATFRRVLEALEPPCPISQKAEVLSLLDPAKSGLANLESRLSANAGGIDIAIARADYFAQMEVVECSPPDLPGVEAKVKTTANLSMKRIQELEVMAAHNYTQDKAD